MSAGALTRLAQSIAAHRDVLGALGAEPRTFTSIQQQLKRSKGTVGRHLGALELLGVAERADGGWRLSIASTSPPERPPEPEVVEVERRVAELPSPARRAKPARGCECGQPIVDEDGCAKCGRST
jgi:hypothetical protein